MRSQCSGELVSMTNDTSLAERLDFLALDEKQIQHIRAVQSEVAAALPGVLEKFYQHISRYAHTSSFFDDSGHMASAKQAQITHWSRIAAGAFDSQYESSVLAIGKTHNRIKLEPRWYIGGYAHITADLLSALADRMLDDAAIDPEQLAAYKGTIGALVKAVFLDMDLAISTYLADEKVEFAGKMERLTDHFDANISEFIKDVGGASESLSTTSESLAGLAQTGLDQAETLAGAAETAATNVNAVASAAEEMSASMNEINVQVTKSNEIARDAVDKSEMASEAISNLQDNAEKIDEVITLIQTISEQTNLLALNATIEAARAGEAGKGFAVVAQEVKNLASQARNATSDISGQINATRDAILSSVEIIADVRSTIKNIEEASLTISSAMEEQGAAIQEIVSSTHNAAQSANEVSSTATAMSENSNTTQSTSEIVRTAAQDLAGKNLQMRGEVETFLANAKTM